MLKLYVFIFIGLSISVALAFNALSLSDILKEIYKLRSCYQQLLDVEKEELSVIESWAKDKPLIKE